MEQRWLKKYLAAGKQYEAFRETNNRLHDKQQQRDQMQLDELKQKHTDELAKLQHQLAAEVQCVSTEAEKRLAGAQAQHTKLVQDMRLEMSNNKASTAAQIASAFKEGQAQSQMSGQHADESAAAMRDLASVRSQYASELASVKEQHATELASVKSQHAHKLASVNKQRTAELASVKKQHGEALAADKRQHDEQSRAQQGQVEQQLAQTEAAHAAELIALKAAQVSQIKVMTDAAESAKQQHAAQLAESAAKLKKVDADNFRLLPYRLRNYWLHIAEKTSHECDSRLSQMQTKLQSSQEAAQVTQLAQRQAETEAAECLRKLQQAEAESAAKLHRAETQRADSLQKLRQAETQQADLLQKLRQAEAVQADLLEKLQQAESTFAAQVKALSEAQAHQGATRDAKMQCPEQVSRSWKLPTLLVHTKHSKIYYADNSTDEPAAACNMSAESFLGHLQHLSCKLRMQCAYDCAALASFVIEHIQHPKMTDGKMDSTWTLCAGSKSVSHRSDSSW